MARAKSPTPVLPVPQSRAEAADFLRRIGDQQREIARIEADLGDELAAAQTKAAAAAQAPRAEAAQLTDGLKAWCEAHRTELTDNGRTKTVDLGTGKVSWRLQPAKVGVRGVEAVITRLKELRYGRFIRTKQEIDKEAILAAPAPMRARLATISGLTIGSDGEAFAVEPLEASLGDAPALAEEAA